MDLKLRPGRHDDAHPCGAICYEAFGAIADQHNFPRDFPAPAVAVQFLSYLLSRDYIYSVVAEINGRVVGSNFLWETGNIAGIGPITVDPAIQNSAVGKQLMIDVVQRVQRQRFAGVRLVQAAYHNRSLALYSKLGFDAREPLSTIQGSPLGLTMPGTIVRPATEADLEACNTLCFFIHGHSRGQELKEAIDHGAASVVERDGRITGYTTGIGFAGHAVGKTNEDLKALIGAAESFAGPGFLLPTRNSELLRWCLGHGLRVIQPMTLMSLGLYNKPAGAFLPSIIY